MIGCTAVAILLWYKSLLAHYGYSYKCKLLNIVIGPGVLCAPPVVAFAIITGHGQWTLLMHKKIIF